MTVEEHVEFFREDRIGFYWMIGGCAMSMALLMVLLTIGGGNADSPVNATFPKANVEHVSERSTSTEDLERRLEESIATMEDVKAHLQKHRDVL